MTCLQRRGLMFVLSSPSGAGKTSITRRLLAEDDRLSASISMTTRHRRPGEVSGQDYYFVMPEEFIRMRDNNLFLEHAKVFDYYYGTPKEPVEKNLSKGQDIIFDIDWQGAQSLTNSARADVVKVFILPPSWEELERRLRARNQDSENVVLKRMSQASNEMSHWAEYDYVIVNHDLEESIRQARAILQGERLRRERQVGLAKFVTTLRTRS
tara:strand:- start:2781 stop:3413 length:633 start_codon:yes stop_codon:yes gene_type:complete